MKNFPYVPNAHVRNGYSSVDIMEDTVPLSSTWLYNTERRPS